MRALKAKDIGPFVKVLSKLGIKDLLKGFFENSTKKEDAENWKPLNGFEEKTEEEKNEEKREKGTKLISEIISLVIDNYYKAEKDFFAFLAEINETTSESIADMPAGEFFTLIKDLFSGENFPFFSLLSKTNQKSET